MPFSHIEKFSKKKGLQIPKITYTNTNNNSKKNEKSVPIIQYPINVHSFTNSEKKEENYIEAKAFYFSQDMIKQFDWAKYNQQDNQNCAIEM